MLQGFNDNWIPLEDWQDEDNEAALREKYPDELLQKKDAFSILKFQYRYIEYEEHLKDILNESYRQWVEFIDDRKDCNLKDYNDFIIEIAKQMEADEQ